MSGPGPHAISFSVTALREIVFLCPQTGAPSAKVIVKGHKPWRGRAVGGELGVNGKRLSLPGTRSHLHHNHSPGLPEGPRPSTLSAWGRPKYSVRLTNTDEHLLCAGHTTIVESTVSYPHRHYHPEEYRQSPPLSVPSLPGPMVGHHVEPCQRSPDHQPQVIWPLACPSG